MKKHSIKLILTQEQLQSLVQFAEQEKEYWYDKNKEETEDWSKIRDQLAYELDMITDYPFKQNV